MPELDPADPHRASAGTRWPAAEVPFRPYVYRGQGYDIFDHSEVPAACTCTWSWGPPSFRWERIGVKEDCPWHRVADMLGVRQP